MEPNKESKKPSHDWATLSRRNENPFFYSWEEAMEEETNYNKWQEVFELFEFAIDWESISGFEGKCAWEAYRKGYFLLHGKFVEFENEMMFWQGEPGQQPPDAFMDGED